MAGLTNPLGARVTVMPYQRVLRYRNGELSDVLEPGRHRAPFGSVHDVVVDLRDQLVAVGSQEVLTSDGIAVRLSAAVTWRVTDPVTFHERTTDTAGHLYVAIQLVLREPVQRRSIDEALAERDAMAAEALPPLTAAIEGLGVEVRRFAIRDLTVPADVRAAFGQVVTARQQALAALERARGESAALRSLANAAQVLEQHPVLVQLRTVETAARAGGTVVLERPRG